MNKQSPNPETDVIEEIETIDTLEVELTPESQTIEYPRSGYFFPNTQEDAPFGGEFSSLEDAQRANEKHLAEHAKKGAN
jgi:hypothetical protein